MENYPECGLLPGFVGSCTEIPRGFFISGIPPFIYTVAESFTPAAPFRESEQKSVFTHWEKLGGKMDCSQSEGLFNRSKSGCL